MAVGGGVRVAPSSMEVWGRRRRTTGTCAARRGATSARIRCSLVDAAEEHYYRTLRLRPGSTRHEVKKAFRRLALVYHPDVCRDSDRDDTDGDQFQKISVAYQMLMSNMREAEERLQYWRLKYGLNDQDLERYRHYLNEEEEDDEWLDV